jgi:plastocyanin
MNIRSITVFLLLASLIVAGCVSDDAQDDTDENITEGEQNETPADENETVNGENGTPADEETPTVDNGTPAENTSGGGVVVVPTTGPMTYTVNLENFLALPANLTIKTGDTVVWFNRNSPTRNFMLISNEGLWEDTTIGYRGRHIYTFNETGTYTYKVQGYEERMKGTINVI